MAQFDPEVSLAHLKANEARSVARLQKLVLQESPSEDPVAINAAAVLVEGWALELGGRAKYHRQKGYGDVLELRFGPTRSGRKPILLLGHLDTVWPLGTLKQMPWKQSGDKLHGPGVLDMKAGIIMALAAIETLAAHNIRRPITLLLNSEEEIGSPVSRPITEKLARESSAVLVLEPAQGLALKTARKGVGDYLVEVTGVSAHSGLDFEKGHSAVLELARQIETIAGFTDLSRGLTVNPGVISGGTRTNVIAAHAQVEVDIRIARASDAAYIDRLFRRLKPHDPHCTLKITGGLNRPPMERTRANAALFRHARQLATQLGFPPLEETSTGGGSDGSFTSALGIPTLDGLGAVGAGAHASHEHILVSHLTPRTALLTALLATLDSSK
jgi:glutamate carboxypeptidase